MMDIYDRIQSCELELKIDNVYFRVSVRLIFIMNVCKNYFNILIYGNCCYIYRGDYWFRFFFFRNL